MTNTIITHLQLFGIGLSFGLIGPCWFVCTPILVSYGAGVQKKFSVVLKELLLFFTARLAAYFILGFMAGAAAYILRSFVDSQVSVLLKQAAGLLAVILGIAVIKSKQTSPEPCRENIMTKAGGPGLFALGFLFGISPCPPLFALLLEVSLMSKSGVEAALYTASFGVGTFLAGMIAATASVGLVKWLPERFIRSPGVRSLFKIICALLLIALGLGMLLWKY